MTENAEINPALSPLTSETKTESDLKGSEYRTLHQHEINDMLKGARERGYQKGQQDLITQNGLQPLQSANPATPNTQGGMGGMAATANPEDIKKLVSEQLAEHSRMLHGQNIVNTFMSKMEQGKSKYPDFDQKISTLGDLKNIPAIVQLAASVDNTHDVMYDLAENPQKIVDLISLAQINPQLAYAQAHKLSASIKANEEASQQVNPSAPLSQLKSSVNTDNGQKNTSISYFKSKYRT